MRIMSLLVLHLPCPCPTPPPPEATTWRCCTSTDLWWRKTGSCTAMLPHLSPTTKHKSVWRISWYLAAPVFSARLRYSSSECPSFSLLCAVLASHVLPVCLCTVQCQLFPLQIGSLNVDWTPLVLLLSSGALSVRTLCFVCKCVLMYTPTPHALTRMCTYVCVYTHTHTHTHTYTHTHTPATQFLTTPFPSTPGLVMTVVSGTLLLLLLVVTSACLGIVCHSRRQHKKSYSLLDTTTNYGSCHK